VAHTLQPRQVFLAALAGWINRHQQAAIDFLRKENRVPLEQLGDRRIRLTEGQRRRLAVAGKAVGRKELLDLSGLVTPDTILAWHRKLVAAKWDHRSRRGPGRPGVMKEIEKHVVRFARENPSWGYRRIEGALANLGHHVARTTVANILRKNGIDPAPERGSRTTWRTFLGAHWSTIAAIDFTTVEVWGRHGRVTMYVLFAIELRSRRVYFAGMTPGPDDAWIRQVGRNLTDPEDGFLRFTIWTIRPSSCERREPGRDRAFRMVPARSRADRRRCNDCPCRCRAERRPRRRPSMNHRGRRQR